MGTRAGAAFKRWTWHVRDPLHPKCLAALRATTTPDGMRRIEALLRVGKFEGDR